MTTFPTPTTPPFEDAMTITDDQTFDAPTDDILDAPNDVEFETNIPDVVQLDDDDLACGQCGRVVAGPLDISEVEWHDVTSVERPGGRGTSSSVAGISAEPLATCATCSTRRDHAHDLARTMLPRGIALGGVHYGPRHTAELVASSLSVLDALGAPLPRQMTRDVLGLLVRRLSPLGTALGWGARFAPHRSADARPGTANGRPWGHVSVEGKEMLRRAYVDYYADKLSLDAPAVRLSPPPFASPSSSGRSLAVPSGCILCGVGTVELPAATVARMGGRGEAAREVWTLRVAVPPHSLGGRRSPNGIAGHTCPTCSAAVQHVGALGISAMERSLTVELDLAGKWTEGADALEGLIGFGALVSDAVRLGKPLPSPNKMPWQHLGDLDQLRAKLAPALGTG